MRLNILLGSKTIKDYWQRFNNLALGLCAYNAGPKSALKWQAQNQGKPIDTLIDNVISYRETHAYVREVLGGSYAYATLDGYKNVPSLKSSASKAAW